MIVPTLERIEIPAADRAAAIRDLETHWVLPDRTEVVDRHALARYRKQLRDGYFLRLVWPPGTTCGQAMEWCDHAKQILEWRKLGLV